MRRSALPIVPRWPHLIVIIWAPSVASLADNTGFAPEAKELFASSSVLSIEIEISEPQIAALRNDHRAYVPATLREGGVVYKQAGVRLKGSAGSFRGIDEEKPGFTVKMNQFLPRGRFHGLRKFLLNNSRQDPSYMSEILGNEIFRAAGIPAAQACYARVFVNGKDFGLYILFESISRDFLANYFELPDGNLYEGPGDVAGEIDSDRAGYNLDQRDLKMLASAAMEPNARLRMRRLREVLDVDRFSMFLALEAALWHWDGYAVGVNNYRIYDDPATGRFVFMPHGSDQLFQDPNGAIVPEVQGLVARAFLSTPEGQQAYRQSLEHVISDVIDSERIRVRQGILLERIQPALSARSEAEAAEQRGAAANLLERIVDRMRSIREQLRDTTNLFGTPLEFDEHGVAMVGGWKPRVELGSPEMVEDSLESPSGAGGKPRWLCIRVGADASCVASWRTNVLLPPGKYRFEGRVHVNSVVPPEKGAEDPKKLGGASLRISHHQPGEKLVGSQETTSFRYDFVVTGGSVEDDPPILEGGRGPEGAGKVPTEEEQGPFAFQVQLVCELEAKSGEAKFDAASLRLIRREP